MDKALAHSRYIRDANGKGLMYCSAFIRAIAKFEETGFSKHAQEMKDPENIHHAPNSVIFFFS